MTDHSLIKQRIIALVPEIMELKFGCRVHTEGSETSGIYVCETEKGSWIISYGDYYGICPRPGYVQILGRPIQLADIVASAYFGEFDGNASLKVEQENAHQLCVMWNPKFDFDGQSDELKDFVGTLLNVK